MTARRRAPYRAKTAPLLHRGDRCRPSCPKTEQCRSASVSSCPVGATTRRPRHCSRLLPPFLKNSAPLRATIGRPLFLSKRKTNGEPKILLAERGRPVVAPTEIHTALATDSRPCKNRRRSIVSPPVPNRRRNLILRGAFYARGRAMHGRHSDVTRKAYFLFTRFYARGRAMHAFIR